VKAFLPPDREATADVVAPKQHAEDRMFPAWIDQPFPRGGGLRNRTASSYGEAFQDSLALMTQPPCEEDDDEDDGNTIGAMEQAAQLDFPSPAVAQSPEEPAGRKPKSSRCYGSSGGHRSNAEKADFQTQPDEGDDAWIDQPFYFDSPTTLL